MLPAPATGAVSTSEHVVRVEKCGKADRKLSRDMKSLPLCEWEEIHRTYSEIMAGVSCVWN